MKRQYFFGYLFAKAAKGLALLVTLIGIGFCFLQYSQATAAAGAIAYQPSASLQRALDNLKNAFSAAGRIVRQFDANNRVTVPNVQEPHFATVIGTDADFAGLAYTLLRVDQNRQQMKESVLSRFDFLVRDIETKLRAHAAGLKSMPSPTAPGNPSGPATVTVAPPPAHEEESLFSTRLSGADLDKRSANLVQRKEFLKVLETKAENPENRLRLNEAADQLEMLHRLLPEKLEAPAAGPSESTASAAEVEAEKNRETPPAARVASQLEQLRRDIRQTFLNSWTLDDAFEQTSDLASAERERCRVAVLGQRGIWLSAISRILIGLLATIMVSFVILVCADLVKTFLDTASHTGVVADAINAMRGATVIAKSQIRDGDVRPPNGLSRTL